jgi:hypothetical protein
MKQHILKSLVLGLFLFAGPSIFAQKTLSIDSVFTVQVKIACCGNYSWPQSKTINVPSNKIWKIEKTTHAFVNGSGSVTCYLNNCQVNINDLINSSTPFWLGSSDQISFYVNNADSNINLSIIQFKLQ